MTLEMSRYHRNLFRWHCQTFYNFRSVFSPSELDYLRSCWRLATDFEEISEGGYEHFSYYTFSHRVRGERVNSSRMAYGSISSPEAAFEAARPVLRERGLELPRSLQENTRFYGLGWDCEEEHFKVYFRTLEWTSLHNDFLKLVASYSPEQHRKEALLSLTFVGDEEVERKLYLYPLDEFRPEGVQGYARMITDRRGEVSQSDMDPGKIENFEFNETGRSIVERYREIGETLDTVAFQDREKFTLYFP